MKTNITKSIYFLCLFFLLSTKYSLHGQVTVGSIPSGTLIIYNIVDLRISDFVRDTITFLDLDDDNLDDVKIWLHNGAPPVDDPHFVKFEMLNTIFSFCTELIPHQRTILYEYGDTICTPGQEWGDENKYVVGCNGGFDCPHPNYYITDKYLGYRNNITDKKGWMKISSSLWSGVTPDSITFSISELLIYPLGTRLDQIGESINCDIFPNPTLDGRCYIRCDDLKPEIFIFNELGQSIITRKRDETADIILPDIPGVYLVKFIKANGDNLIKNLIRL